MKHKPMPVVDHVLIPSFNGDSLYYLCPNCKILLPREHMHYCDNCGQHLCWIIHLPCHRKSIHSAHQNQETLPMSY